jgi:hypothetical protein
MKRIHSLLFDVSLSQDRSRGFRMKVIVGFAGDCHGTGLGVMLKVAVAPFLPDQHQPSKRRSLRISRTFID